MADPEGSAALLKAIGGGGPEQSSILSDPQLLAVIGNFPLARLAAFPGFGLDDDVMRSLGL
jgi:hypothetical protein